MGGFSQNWWGGTYKWKYIICKRKECGYKFTFAGRDKCYCCSKPFGPGPSPSGTSKSTGAWAAGPPGQPESAAGTSGSSLLAAAVEFATKIAPKSNEALSPDREKVLQVAQGLVEQLRQEKAALLPLSSKFRGLEARLAKAKKAKEQAKDKAKEAAEKAEAAILAKAAAEADLEAQEAKVAKLDLELKEARKKAEAPGGELFSSPGHRLPVEPHSRGSQEA